MKHLLLRLITCTCLCAAFLPLFAQSYNKLWKAVDAAQKKDLPQTVISLTDKIFAKAEAERNAAQMLKAYFTRSEYRQRISADSFYVDLKGLETWAEQEQATSDKAVLHTLIARLYSDYAAQNSWQLQKRSNVSVLPDADIRVWSANQFVEKVLQHTTAALEHNDSLFTLSSKRYVPFVAQHEGSKYVRHNLYHLLAYYAINSLLEVNEFAADEALKMTVFSIYRKLEAYYKLNKNNDGLVIVALDELNNHHYLRPQLTDEEYIAGLDELIAAYGESEVCAEVYLDKANHLNVEETKPEALKLCEEAIARYPDYFRVNALKSLKAQILHPFLSAEFEQMGYPGEYLDLKIEHRNLTGFTLHVYESRSDTLSQSQLNDIKNETALLKLARIVASFPYKLEDKGDYRMADTVVKWMVPHNPGLYVIRVEAAGTAETRLFPVSRLRIISSELPENNLQVSVLDGLTGHPVNGVTIKMADSDKDKNRPVETAVTDKAGRVSFKSNSAFRWIFAEKDKDRFMTSQYVYMRHRGLETTPKEQYTLKILTDRSIYRPGQTLYLKGIAYVRQGDVMAVVSDKKFEVKMFDANRKEVSAQTLKSNEFGSFSSTFTIPSGGLNGTYTIETDYGREMFRVEEYKRPSFEVVFEKVKETYQPGDSIEVNGNVQTFSGVPMRDLQVKYSITSHYNNWWRFSSGDYQSVQINDSVTLDSQGRFVIPVHLKASEGNNNLDGRGYYSYTIEATVTNPAGETQSSSMMVFAGYRSMLLDVRFEQNKRMVTSLRLSKDHPIQATFTARNLNMDPIEAEGKYALYPYSGENLKEQPLPPVAQGTFIANKTMDMEAWNQVPSGRYTLILKTLDHQGREVTAESEWVLFSSGDTRPPIETDMWLYVENDHFNAETAAQISFGTSLKDVYVMMDVLGNKRFKDEVLMLSDSIVHFTIPYLPEYADGVVVHFAFMKNNKTYAEGVRLLRKQPENKLNISWETFRDKLRPGQKEEWRMVVKTPGDNPANAEVLAMMYDASLDKIFPRNASQKNFEANFTRNIPYFNRFLFNYRSVMAYLNFKGTALPYTPFKLDEFLMYAGVGRRVSALYGSATRKDYTGNISIRGIAGVDIADEAVLQESIVMPMMAGASVVNQEEVPLRTNFCETAFFYPQLRTNEHGVVTINFTLPESLTRWNFAAYAHTKEMYTGMFSEDVVASKEFMLSPNMPRFVRMGDQTSVAASVINLTEQSLSGNVIFTLFDPFTEKTISTQQLPFKVDANGQTAVSFTLNANDKYAILGCRMVAKAGNFSDGEQHLLPVLSNREQVIEAVSMPVKGGETRAFDLSHLFNHQSTTAANKRLTLEFSGNPAWYAVQALPSLSLPQSDNAISLVSTYYANALAAYILNSQPRIKAMFNTWRKQGGSKETFMSNLQKNQDVKAILLEESPWLMEATHEQERMERVAALFELNALQYNNTAALSRLAMLQRKNGGISWFTDMPASSYVSLYVAEQLVRLQHLTGASVDPEAQHMLNAIFDYLDAMTLQEYARMLEREKESAGSLSISTNTLNYLYLMALSGREVPAGNRKAHAYFIGKLTDETKRKSIARKAMAAIVLHHAGKRNEAKLLTASMKEYMTYKKDKGMFFDTGAIPAFSWWNLQLPVQVRAMEALNYTGEATEVIEEMKLWLLSQKKTQQWDSPVTTANAVYALLSFGENLMENRGKVEVELGGRLYNTESSANTTPGVAYLKEVITDPAVLKKATTATVHKHDAGVAWGAVYAQFEEDMGKVSSSAEGLNVQKTLYVERLINGQKELVPVTPEISLTPGDRVVSRLIIGINEQMDFVQLRDQRAACFEPENNLSGYRRGDQVSYYVDVKDASTLFFFYGLQKGVYVLEHGYRVTRAGNYESGLSILQSAYSPEHVSYAPSVKINVTPF